jgi:hypothetical protein
MILINEWKPLFIICSSSVENQCRPRRLTRSRMPCLLAESVLLERSPRRYVVTCNKPLFSSYLSLLLKGMRFFKSIGLGFKTPKAASEGTYVDKKCPFTGNVSIRGRILKGIVISTKMKRTIVIRRDYLQYVKKYRR